MQGPPRARARACACVGGRAADPVAMVVLGVALLVLRAHSSAVGPCDIYAQGGTPCVAAHSMTRALFGNYTGPLCKSPHRRAYAHTDACRELAQPVLSAHLGLRMTWMPVLTAAQITYRRAAPRRTSIRSRPAASRMPPHTSLSAELQMPATFSVSHAARLAPHRARADVASKQRLHTDTTGCYRHAGIYDQSVWQNHLGLEGPAQRGHNINPLRNIQDLPVNFTDPRSKTTLHGQPVFAAFFAGAPAGFDGQPFVGQGYSNRSAQGTAQGDESETLYAVMGNPKEPISGRGNCCFVRPSLLMPVRDCCRVQSGLILVCSLPTPLSFVLTSM